MGIKKGIVDLIRRLLPSNVCQTHIVKAMGYNKSLKYFTIHDITQSIQIEFINNLSEDTSTGLLKRQSAPQWSEGIRTHSAEITKNEYGLAKMVFTTD